MKMSKQKKIKPGDLVEMWDEELKYMGVGVYIRKIDLGEEWEFAEGGDCWVYVEGSEYVFWHDELDPIDPKRKRAQEIEKG